MSIVSSEQGSLGDSEGLSRPWRTVGDLFVHDHDVPAMQWSTPPTNYSKACAHLWSLTLDVMGLLHGYAPEGSFTQGKDASPVDRPAEGAGGWPKTLVTG